MKKTDLKEKFSFCSAPPASADEILSSQVLIDPETNLEKAVVTSSKRDFHRYDGLTTKDYSIQVLQRTNPAALAMVNRTLSRDKVSAVAELSEKVGSMAVDLANKENLSNSQNPNEK